MAKKDKPKVDKIVKKVNEEFEKTSSHIEKLITDALKQFDNLQSQIQNPIQKLCKEIDELREREMKRFYDQFERRLQEFQDMQNSLLERLGLSHSDDDKRSEKPVAKVEKPVSKQPALPVTAAPEADIKSEAKVKTSQKAKPIEASVPAQSPKPEKAEAPAKVAAKPAAKAKAKSKPKAMKLADPTDLTRINGIGPATQKKMKQAGLTTIGQIAYPSAEDEEKLKAFAGIKGFAQFSSEAKKIV